MTGHRERQKEATRRALLATALALFAERGYHRTTVDDIARAASTTRVTFYAYFESRRDLMIALLGELDVILGRAPQPGEHGEPTSPGATDSPGAAATPLVEAVRIGTAESLGTWLRDQTALWEASAPYVLAATEAAAVDPEIREIHSRWFEDVIGEIVAGLDLADRHPADTRRQRGELAMAQFDHVARRWMRTPWDLDADPALEVLTESWTKLLG